MHNSTDIKIVTSGIENHKSFGAVKSHHGRLGEFIKKLMFSKPNLNIQLALPVDSKSNKKFHAFIGTTALCTRALVLRMLHAAN